MKELVNFFKKENAKVTLSLACFVMAGISLLTFQPTKGLLWLIMGYQLANTNTIEDIQTRLEALQNSVNKELALKTNVKN